MRHRLESWWKYDGRRTVVKWKEDVQRRCANALPKWLKYWVIIGVAVDVSHDHPTKLVPEITWDDMIKNIEYK